jgi:hypothetical protein
MGVKRTRRPTAMAAGSLSTSRVKIRTSATFTTAKISGFSKPVRAPAAGAGGRHQAAGGQVLVEGGELVLIRRFQRERIDGAEVAHAGSFP